MPRGVEVIGFILFVVLLGLVIPVLMNSSISTERYYADIEENETAVVGGQINVTVTEANITGGYSKVQVIDHETLETDEKTIQDGENATYSFSPGNVTVGVNDTGSRGTRLYVDMRTSYGWDEGATLLGGRLPLILGGIVLGVLLVFAAAGISGGSL